MESVQFAFEREVQSRTCLYVIGIAFGYCKLYFQRRKFGELGYNGGGRRVCPDTDLPQTDNSVKGSAKFGLCNVGLYQVDVGIQGCQLWGTERNVY